MDDVDEMQREILEAVDQKGPLYSGSPSTRALKAKYPDAYDATVRLSVVTQDLLKEGYLLPFTEGEREGEAEVVSAKGLKRLWELQHPTKHWFKANLALLVAVAAIAVSATIGAVTIIVELYRCT